MPVGIEVLDAVHVDLEHALGQPVLAGGPLPLELGEVLGALQPLEGEECPAGGDVLELDPHVLDLALGGDDVGLDGGAAEELVVAGVVVVEELQGQLLPGDDLE